MAIVRFEEGPRKRPRCDHHSLPQKRCSQLGGVGTEVRQVLGHHSTGKKSHEICNRDLLAEPLRQLESLLQRIRTGAFLSDTSRSGMVTDKQYFRSCQYLQDGAHPRRSFQFLLRKQFHRFFRHRTELTR